MTTTLNDGTYYSLDDTADCLKDAHLVFERVFENVRAERDPAFIQIHPLPPGRVRVRVEIETLTER